MDCITLTHAPSIRSPKVLEAYGTYYAEIQNTNQFVLIIPYPNYY